MDIEQKIITNVEYNDDVQGNITNESTLVGTLNNETNLDTKISTTINMETIITNESTIDGNLNPGFIKVTTNKHNDLLNRDLPNQHPINAIEGLKEELLSIKNTQETTNLSIRNLENRIINKIRTVKNIPQDMQIGSYIFLEKGGD